MLTPRENTSTDGKTSWRVLWRLGGTRVGRQQSVTFSEVDFGKKTAKKYADAAARLVEAHQRNVTREAVYASILGLDLDEPETDELTLNEFFTSWCATKVDVDDGTLARYRGDWRARIAPTIGQETVASIDPDRVKEWVADLSRTKVSRGGARPKGSEPGALPSGQKGATMAPRTVHKYHALLHQVLDAAVPKHLEANPARGTGLPKLDRGKTRETRVFLDRAEADLLLAGFTDEWARDLVETMLETGLRWSEATALQGEDLLPADENAKLPPRVKVQRAWKYRGKAWVLGAPEADDDERRLAQAYGLGEPKSRRSRREVPVDAAVFAMLQSHADPKNKRELLFRSPRGSRQPAGSARGGRRLDYNVFMRDRWRPAVRRAQGLDPRTGDPLPVRERPSVLLEKSPTPHACRHTYAKWSLEAGIPLTVLSARLGHDSSDFTWRTYGHLDPSANQQVMESGRARKARTQKTPRTGRSRKR